VAEYGAPAPGASNLLVDRRLYGLANTSSNHAVDRAVPVPHLAPVDEPRDGSGFPLHCVRVETVRRTCPGREGRRDALHWLLLHAVMDRPVCLSTPWPNTSTVGSSVLLTEFFIGGSSVHEEQHAPVEPFSARPDRYSHVWCGGRIRRSSY
jgi:hypothetical protein